MFPQNNKQKSDILFIHAARVVACIAVVAIHVVNVIPAKIDFQLTSLWWLANVVTSLSVWAVPVFVMLSGAVLLPKYQESSSVFFKKRLSRVGLAASVWIPFSFVFYHFYRGDSLAVMAILNRVIHSGFDHLYFLILILELYVITPMLRSILKNASTTTSVVLTFLFLYIGVLWPRSSFIGTMFIPYIGYYLLGVLLVQPHKLSVKNGWLWFGLLLNEAVIILGNYYLTLRYGIKYQNDMYLYYYIAPQLVTLSTVIFLLFKQIQPPGKLKQFFTLNRLKSLSTTTLGIYIVHPFVLLLFVLLLKTVFHITTVPWLGIILGIPFITAISYSVVRLFQKIPFLRYCI